MAKYKLTRGTHRRSTVSPSGVTEEIFTAGMVFEPDECEIKALGDRLAPVEPASAEIQSNRVRDPG